MAPVDPEKVPGILADIRDTAPDDLQEAFVTFEEYWERKLWHELTNLLGELFDNPQSLDVRLPLFNDFISAFADRINQLKLASLGLCAAEKFEDDNERLSFLQKLATTVDKPSSQDAFVYVRTAVASIMLRTTDLDGAQKVLIQCDAILNTFDSVETQVHAAFYRTNSDYYQAKHEFASYYKDALLYLACIELTDITPEERQVRAYDLSIAALVSDSIYNFGELLLHPILDSLLASPHSWLRDLLFAFNRGDLAAYDVLAGNVSKNELLRQHQAFLHQKICLSALTETVFRRAPQDRSMNFNTLRHETKVKPDEIEHLIMKALSLGLVRGTIDQVAQIANINWVQPKVLDMKQVEGMRVRLRNWDASVNQLGTWMEGVGKEVWAT
ncbi:MAG: 26S proteasome regulatory subunit [Chrysothrix sp. TS-e1954]|nr:MAG: 26S proteasome regulatory subunit [Chrysothrix sp. TS-e1954]